MATISLFKCPTDATLPDIPNQDCAGYYGQVWKVAFMLKQAAAPFTATTIAQTTTWNTLLSADDATKAVVVDVVGFNTPEGDIITQGGNDNTTYKGKPEVLGLGFVTATFMVKGASPEKIRALRQLTQFSQDGTGRTQLWAYFLTDENFVQSTADFKGIPVSGLIFKSLNKGGEFKGKDNYNAQFYLDGDWDDNLTYTKASFDVLDLKNP